MKEINIESWNRKEHYEFFSTFKSPHFGFTANVNCTKAYKLAKENHISFFAYYFHKSIIAANAIREFKLRIIDHKVYELDQNHAGSTIARDDHTFAFSYIDFDEDFDVFNSRLQKEIEAVKNSTGLRLDPDKNNVEYIRYTTIPWVSFTQIIHPSNIDNTDSVPRISFGKFFKENGALLMPVSVEGHHGLMDGYHISEFFRIFEELLNS
ncbi:chloramphenicol acetyltransferase [Plebeiibacterium sediminum]|uniref:Chloramphenicol acetyltransferase n=1 Tax=Plebeiibacterium sediminum TaxID=2992112 RepID=A0AAE3SHQ3_9BACT|nr:chloramphenicol acetyltransferase [Plebeiobacterium sediminum]MCW3789497.1 chloramphenicol acetyltransferase [Plebeiobacterium sediminum]